jgi:endonuclease/exonuclease/phosphatase family metal-dependent hydrolase
MLDQWPMKKWLMLTFLLGNMTTVSASLQARELKVLSFNIYGLPRPFFSNPKYHQRIKNLCQVLKNTSHPHNQGWDVILMQEVLSRPVRKILSDCGYPHVMDVAASGDRREGFMETGLLILSKHPMTFKKLIPYQERGVLEGFESIAERIVHRSLQLAKIDFYGTEILIANTHLAPNFAPTGSTNAKARIEQMKETIELIRKYSQGQPFVLGGDLNFGPTAPSWEPLWDELPTLFPEISASFNDAIETTFDADNVLTAHPSDGKLDHVFSSQHFEARDGSLALDKLYILSGRFFNYSDHYGWQRTFELKPQ